MVFERQIISPMNLILLTMFIENGNNTFFLWIFPFCSVLRVLAYSWYLKCYYFGRFSQIWVDTVSDPFFIALAARNSNKLFPVLSHAEYFSISSPSLTVSHRLMEFSLYEIREHFFNKLKYSTNTYSHLILRKRW